MRELDNIVNQLLRKIESLLLTKLEGYQGLGSERITNLYKYLKRFGDAVDYDYFRAMGLPIGSGEVESAYRYIPQKRLKIPGTTWHPSAVNPILALRIIRANGWWDDFWTKQLASAHKPQRSLDSTILITSQIF